MNIKQLKEKLEEYDDELDVFAFKKADGITSERSELYKVEYPAGKIIGVIIASSEDYE